MKGTARGKDYLRSVDEQDRYWQNRIRQTDPADVQTIALELFAYQTSNNPVYHEFCRLIRRDPAQISQLDEIPFLPISFFKTHLLQCENWEPQMEFRSSGTIGMTSSRHAVKDLQWYHDVTRWGFSAAYGPPEEWCWLALLPGYLDREGSSLISMAEHFIQRSIHPESGFYLRDHDRLIETIERLCDRDVPVMLLGVTFALLQLAERKLNWSTGVQVLETGGMKGMGPELIRSELHHLLKEGLGVSTISSEYGMTELFSQAYTNAAVRFVPAPTLIVTTRDIHDPFSFPGYGRTGRLCMIDLANYATQAFIQTDDLGRVYPDGQFDVLGRMDGSDIRGCNLLISEFTD
ncbi:MAG: acyl transferase [Saprospiraceae bacterium]|nr:acyl transferase [Saprospiraceae bacterium]